MQQQTVKATAMQQIVNYLNVFETVGLIVQQAFIPDQPQRQGPGTTTTFGSVAVKYHHMMSVEILSRLDRVLKVENTVPLIHSVISGLTKTTCQKCVLFLVPLQLHNIPQVNRFTVHV